ncbi:KIF-binding protein-like [Anopheles aquasalis]|uniref:KIF-binding protein-like n=1 Tax=Anopheles aquasalis TaxID=42839 RepID=UPI00215B024E|nr:KIF-binding protein-like [Anopheles aquasalis]
MKINKETLSDIREEYEKAHRLINEESENDPPTEPFRSHYSARDVLNAALRKVKTLAEALDPASEAATTVRCIRATILKDLAKISTFVEESNGEVLLNEALELIEADRGKEPALNVHIEILNEIAIMCCNNLAIPNCSESKVFLDQAKDIYADAKERELEPLTIAGLFGSKEEVEKGKALKLLESNHTLTLYYLAQVFGFLDNELEKARYCCITLKRQLEYNEYEHVDWILNASTLSQYYYARNHLTQARHLLAASTYMLHRYEAEVVEKITNPEERAEKEENLRHGMADIARCWAKYGLHILRASHERLSKEDDCDEEGTKEPPLTPVRKMERFVGLELGRYEDQAPDEFCVTFDDAELVMLNSLSWLNKAKEYYTKESEAIQYTDIVHDVALLYRHLSFFTADEGIQYKLLKRNVNQLEEIIDILNPTYYQSICRSIWYELGLTYYMLNIRFGQMHDLQSTELPTRHTVNKINRMCGKSIQNFKKFLTSYNVPLDTLQLPASVEEGEMPPMLNALLLIGRLHYRIITPDKRLKLKSTENSLLYYGQLVEWCKEERTKSMFLPEMEIGKQLISKVRVKIEKLKAEIAQ